MLNPNSWLAALLVLLAIFAMVTPAQTITGTMTGSVVDPRGAAVVGAEVSVAQDATGTKRTVQTNELGDFQIGSLQPGVYTMTVATAGFKTLQRTNIDSFQATARRRFAQHIQFGLAWTWSMAFNFANFDANPVSVLADPRYRDYGLSSSDRTHNLRIDWTYDLPHVRSGNSVIDYVFSRWQLSGITSFVSGQPLAISYTTVTPVDITGTPSQGARIDVVSDPVLPKSERTFSRNFATEAFALPARNTFGNSATTQIRGPGTENWDMVLIRELPIREQIRMQFRVEAFNAFNHTQFATLDTSARFDAAGNQVNARFGEFLSSRPPRIMQLALRFMF